MKGPKPENNIKVSDKRLLCTVCKRVFRSLPALNGHMCSHSSVRLETSFKKGDDSPSPAQNAVSVVMPVSMNRSEKRCSHTSAAIGGTVLYHSLMEQEKEADEDVNRSHYTPKTPINPVENAKTLHNEIRERIAMETLTIGTRQPRINVGLGFQAEIPPLCVCKNATSESHNPLLLWTPLEELQVPVNHHRVESLLLMARSSVVPGGRASPEHTLHLLSESRGDFLETVEKLLSMPKSNNKHTGLRLKTRRPKGVKRRRRSTRQTMGAQEEEKKKEDEKVKPALQQKSSKEVYFSVLPDRYEPLIEEEEEEVTEERRRRKEEKKRKKKAKFKKYRKNAGKALRFTMRCMLLGLQNMAYTYVSPASMATTVAMGMNKKT